MALLIISVCFVNAQSKDGDNPTLIISNKASAFFDGKDDNSGFYYSYQANSGELKITLSLEAGKNSINQISFDVYDENARKLATKNITAGLGKKEKEIIRINIEKKQTILFRIFVEHANGEAQYQLQLEETSVSQNNSSTTGNSDNKVIQCGFCTLGNPKLGGGTEFTTLDLSKQIQELLPKKGTLLIKTKDGGTVVINLNEVETFYVKSF